MHGLLPRIGQDIEERKTCFKVTSGRSRFALWQVVTEIADRSILPALPQGPVKAAFPLVPGHCQQSELRSAQFET